MANDLPVCSTAHCSNISANIAKRCKEQNWPAGYPAMVCDTDGYCCTCACSCLAYNTPVAIGNGETKAIQTFRKDDLVLVYDVNGKEAPGLSKVGFSDGTGPNSVQPEMAYVTYAYADVEKKVAVTLDHAFLLANGKLIQAQMLTPGMELRRPGGGVATVTNIAISGYTGGVWNISTTTDLPTTLSGHIIATQDILSGDYTVQLYYEEMVAAGLAVPVKGTPVAGSALHNGTLSAASAVAPRQQISVEEFIGNQLAAARVDGGPVPAGVHLQLDSLVEVAAPRASADTGFLTQVQAAEVQAHCLPETGSDRYKMTLLEWLLTSFRAFNPDITFLTDVPSLKANAFAFRLGDSNFIMVQGGLIRAAQLGWQGLALVLAQTVARFRTGDSPCGSDGLVCKPLADYNASSELQRVFSPLYPHVIGPGYQQVKALFGEIKTTADAPVPGCHGSTLGCRLQTITAGMGFLDIPACACGGDPSIPVTPVEPVEPERPVEPVAPEAPESGGAQGPGPTEI